MGWATAPLVTEPDCLLDLTSLTSPPAPEKSQRMSVTLDGGLLCLDRAGDPFLPTVGLFQPGQFGEGVATVALVVSNCLT